METKRQNFSLGRLLSTPGAIDTLDPGDMLTALGRHVRCDWGDCCPEDWRANDEAVDQHLARFGTELKLLRIAGHLELLHAVGFATAEIFWRAHLQAGCYAIKSG